MKRSIKSVLLFLSFLILCGLQTSAIAHRLHPKRNYVIPTWYGYGSTERHSGVLRPYIVPGNPAYYPPSYSYYWGSPYYYYPPYWSWTWYYPYYSAVLYGATMYYPYSISPVWYGYYYFPVGATLGIVTATSLNVRDFPSANKSNKVGTLSYGEYVWIYGRNGNWYYIRSINRPNLIGYAHGDYFNLIPNYPPSYYYPPTYYYR